MSRFPKIQETFILRELDEMTARGWSLEVFPLIHEKPARVHPGARPWIDSIEQIPFYSSKTLNAVLMQLVRQPGRLISTWFQALIGNWPNFKFMSRALILFPKAVYIAAQAEAQDIHHFHVHFATHPALAAWIIHRLNRTSYSITVHAHDIFVSQAMLHKKLRHAALVVAISDFNRDYLIQRYGAELGDRIEVIRSGIDPERYALSERMPESRPFSLFMTGSLEPYKGHQVLIECCQLLKTAGLDFNCSLAGEGHLRQKLETRIQEAGLANCVHLLGNLTEPEIAAQLQKADCYIQSSVITPQGKMEGIPVSLMEALACTLPVVASDISGISELVIDGKTGRLVPAGDPEALAAAVLQVHSDPERHSEMGRAGRAHVLENYNLIQNVGQLSRRLTEVLGG